MWAARSTADTSQELLRARSGAPALEAIAEPLPASRLRPSCRSDGRIVRPEVVRWRTRRLKGIGFGNRGRSLRSLLFATSLLARDRSAWTAPLGPLARVSAFSLASRASGVAIAVAVVAFMRLSAHGPRLRPGSRVRDRQRRSTYAVTDHAHAGAGADQPAVGRVRRLQHAQANFDEHYGAPCTSRVTSAIRLRVVTVPRGSRMSSAVPFSVVVHEERGHVRDALFLLGHQLCEFR